MDEESRSAVVAAEVDEDYGVGKEGNGESKATRLYTVEEAGLSFWAPPWLLLLVRVASCGYLLSVGVRTTLLNARLLLRLDEMNVFTLALSFLMLSVCTVLSMCSDEKRSAPAVVFRTYHMSATFALFVAPVGWITYGLWRQVTEVSLVRLVSPLLLFLLDVVILQSRVCFRHRYVWLVLLVFGAYLILVFVTKQIKLTMIYITQTVGALLALFIWLFLASMIVTALTRSIRLCRDASAAEEW